MTWDEFLELINRHDLTYEYSDDARVYRKGSESFTTIRREAQQFQKAKVEEAWNKMCDTKSPKNGSMFYWR